MSEFKIEPEFHMNAEGLLSKWGFSDGDALNDWWWDTYAEGPWFDTHDVLFALALEYLAPAVEASGHSVRLIRMHTIHNPVRAEILDGKEVDWYNWQADDFFSPAITASVKGDQILAVAERLERHE